jgi:hypothetical protein
VKSFKLDWDEAAFVFPADGRDLFTLMADLIEEQTGEPVQLG